MTQLALELRAVIQFLIQQLQPAAVVELVVAAVQQQRPAVQAAAAQAVTQLEQQVIHHQLLRLKVTPAVMTITQTMNQTAAVVELAQLVVTELDRTQHRVLVELEFQTQ
jgi:hypothetical protein